MKNTNTKKLGLFYKIYFIAISVFLMLTVLFLFILNGIISEYNKGIPETVSENFFKSTFLELDADTIIEMSKTKPSEFETRKDIKDFIERIMSSGLTYTSISSDTEDKKYIVKSGEFKCASFTLSMDENGDYYPSSLSLHLPKENSRTYKILDSSKLYINGVEVSNNYKTSEEKHENAKYLPENVTAPQWVTYTIDGLTKEPDVYITDRNGNRPNLLDNEGILYEEIIYDAEESEITDKILAGAKQYAICMQDDAPKSTVYPYFEKGTDLYNSIRSVENSFVWEHSGYAIEDEKISEFFRYDENTVSLRVSFTHVLKKHGQADYRDITDITYFARNIDGKYMIFARHNNI